MAVEQDVKVVINGEDKSGPAFKSASKSMQVLNTDVSGLAKTLAGGVLAGGAALTAFLYSSAKAAGDAEVAMARVNTTLERTVDAMSDSQYQKFQDQAGKTGDVLDYLSGKIEEASSAAVGMGFDDEDAAESMAKLFQRTGDLTEAYQLQNLAMDLARAKNIELLDASNLVGQVLSGNGRILKQYGIEISDTLTPMQALTQLQQQVGGNADAFTRTFQGQMQILTVAFNNFKEVVGAGLLQAIMPFINQLTAWSQKKETQQKIKEIGDEVKSWTEVILPVAIETLKIWWDWLNKIVSVLSTLGDAVMKAYNALDNLFKKLDNSSLSKAFHSALQAVGSDTGQPGLFPSAFQEVQYLLGARASGGSVMGGGSYLVGEKGPEIFTPGSSGFIIPNGGGAITINIMGNTLLDNTAGEKIAEQIMFSLRGNLRI